MTNIKERIKNMKIKSILTLAILSASLAGFASSGSSLELPHASYETSTDSSFAEIFPTPFENEIFVRGFSDPEKEIRVEIFSAGNGVLVRTIVLENPLSATKSTLDLTGLQEELFVVRVYENEKLLVKKRVIKKT